MTERPIVVVSNRGPSTFSFVDDGDTERPDDKRNETGPGPRLAPGAPAGGLARGLRPLVASTGGSWFACAVSDADRAAARLDRPDPAIDVRLIDNAPERYRAFYDVISNGTLWFVHHNLWDLPNWPSFDDDWLDAWQSYVAVNETMAEAVASHAPANALVLVQDYHFSLIAGPIRQRRPDVLLTHFSHTPFAGVETMRVLPAATRRRLVAGLAEFDACGFHTQRWATNYLDNCGDLDINTPTTFVSPLPPDISGIAELAAGDECASRHESLDADLGDCALVLVSGRLELSKNLVRAMEAFELLLDREPRRSGTCVLAAFVYASREGLPEYQAYREACVATAERINRAHGTADWQPIRFDANDDLPRSIAGLRRYDVLVINPIRDGLNLVAFEGPAVNERDGVLILSDETGAHAQLHDAALSCQPYDVSELASLLAVALDMAPADRRSRANQLRSSANARSIDDWLAAHRRAVDC